MPVALVGQIWRKVETDRHVVVSSVTETSVAIRRVIQGVSRWDILEHSQTRYVGADKFNGKLGGYEYVEAGMIRTGTLDHRDPEYPALREAHRMMVVAAYESGEISEAVFKAHLHSLGYRGPEFDAAVNQARP